MDFSTLFQELLKLSPFVATLFYFLFTVWKTMQKKDEALTSVMREHSTSMLTLQKDSIMAQNNAAESNRQLSGAIAKLSDTQEDLCRKVDDLQPRNRNGSRRPGIVTEPKPLGG